MTMRRLAVAILMSFVFVMATASAAFAVDPHQHVMTNDGTQTWIARGICINDLQRAVDAFHAKVHTGTPMDAQASNPARITAVACPAD
jgi:hypothetical protein